MQLLTYSSYASCAGGGGGLQPGTAGAPLARGVGTPLATGGTGSAPRVTGAPLGAWAPRPGGGGGIAPPRPLWAAKRDDHFEVYIKGGYASATPL